MVSKSRLIRKTSLKCECTCQNHPHIEFNYNWDFLVNILVFSCIFCTLFAWSVSLVGWLHALLACPFFCLFKPGGDSLEKNPFSQRAGIYDLFTSELHHTISRPRPASGAVPRLSFSSLSGPSGSQGLSSRSLTLPGLPCHRWYYSPIRFSLWPKNPYSQGWTACLLKGLKETLHAKELNAGSPPNSAWLSSKQKEPLEGCSIQKLLTAISLSSGRL